MVIAITGITGFLGFYLAKHFVNNDDIYIKALVRMKSSLEHLKCFGENITFVQGELCEAESLNELLDGADAVIHAAFDRQNGSFYESGLDDKEEFLQTNLMGSYKLLEQAREEGVKKFIFISSCAVFGAIDKGLPLDEKHPLMPDSLYGAYKASIEALCHAYFLRKELETVIFRPVAIYGKHPKINRSRWYNLINDIKNGQDVEVTGGGKIVHVEDVVKAIDLAIINEKAAGNVYALVDFFIDNMGIANIAKEIYASKSKISGANKFVKNIMCNEKANQLGVKFKGNSGLRKYISDLMQ